MKYGFIGCGNMGTGHLKNFASGKIKNVEVTAICDINEEKFAPAKAIIGENVKTYTDYKEMIKREDIGAVMISTTWITHSRIAVDCMKAGKHVFCEKPDAINVEEVLKMKAASEKAGKVLMVMRNNRYYSNSKYLKEFIKNAKTRGEHGEVKHIKDGFHIYMERNYQRLRDSWEQQYGLVPLEEERIHEREYEQTPEYDDRER